MAISFNVLEKDSYSLVEIWKNGKPTSQENPVIDEDYTTVLAAYGQIKEVSGKLAVVSGVPGDMLAGLACELKNRFGAIAVHAPRLKAARVIHSVSSNYPYGAVIPLS